MSVGVKNIAPRLRRIDLVFTVFQIASKTDLSSGLEDEQKRQLV